MNNEAVSHPHCQVGGVFVQTNQTETSCSLETSCVMNHNNKHVNTIWKMNVTVTPSIVSMI